MSLRRWSSFASLSAVLLAPAAASASPLFELTGASSGNGGLNARVAGTGAASTYFNPALLANTEQGFELSLLILSDHIGITVDGRASGDVPDAVGSRDQVNGAGAPISNLTVPTRWLQRGCPPDECKGGGFAARPRQAAGSSGNTRAYQVLGLVNHVVKDKLVIGFHAIVPLGSFTTASAFYNDEREQFFTNSLHPELYSDRLTATSLAFGLGGKLLDNLSVGLAFTLNLRNEAAAPTYVRDANNYDSLLLATDVKVHASVSPHFGAAWSPLDWLHLAGTVHSEQKFQIDTTFSALLPSGIETKTSRHEVHDFVPWTFGFGGGVDVHKTTSDTVELVTHGTYALWSYYLDRHGDSPGSYGNYLMWKNTLSGAVGARWDHEGTRTFFDISWVPSPVPLQIGRSNYVDNDRAGFSTGIDHKFQLFGLNLRAGIMGQAHVLFRRYQQKYDYLLQDELPDDARSQNGQPVPGRAGLQTNNPGWPGFASQGVVLGSSATIALLY